MATYNLFVKLLDGNTVNLRLNTSSITGESIKRRLYIATRIPTDNQLLLSNGRIVCADDTLISASAGTVYLLLRLVGGKGRFGSPLRGAGTNAGQKMTNNFDACLDMSGWLLRHVIAEKKLEEWQVEAVDRWLEKLVEEFPKKKKKPKIGERVGEAEKYVEKFREDSAKCVEVVEASVREAFEVYKNSKRKATAAPKLESKKLKTW